MPSYIGIGVSTNQDPFEAGRLCCLQAQKHLGQRSPNLIILFSTIHFVNKKLLEAIKNVFGQRINVLGISGGGIIAPSGMLKYGVALMAIHSTQIHFTTSCIKNIDKLNYQAAGEDLARDLLRQLAKSGIKHREIGMIFMDGLIEKGSEVLLGIKNILGRSFPIVGGSAADNLRFSRTFQFYNDRILSNSLTGVILSKEALCGYGIRHGWQPLGRPLFVTQSTGNVINKIDGKPAVNVYEEYFEKSFKELKASIAGMSILYPLGIYLTYEEEYLLRNITHVEDDGSLVCQGDVAKGSQIRLMMGTKESALQSARQAAAQAKNAMRGGTLLGAIIFDSVSRNQLLGSKTNEEVDTIRKILGDDTPFIGVSTFGEQAPLKSLEYRGESHFHNETVAVITLGKRQVDVK